MSHVPSGRLWFGLLAAAVAWAAQGFLSVLIATEACRDSQLGGGRGALIVLTLAALALAVAGGMVTHTNWRRLSEQTQFAYAEGRSREEFLALTGIFLSVIFIIGIIWGGLPLALLDVCEATR